MLPVSECAALLRAAEKFENGHLAPYVALCLFGGLRPFEAARLSWEPVNLKDSKIRLKWDTDENWQGADCGDLHDAQIVAEAVSQERRDLPLDV